MIYVEGGDYSSPVSGSDELYAVRGIVQVLKLDPIIEA